MLTTARRKYKKKEGTVWACADVLQVARQRS